MGYSVDFISFDCYSDTTVLINKFGIRDEEKSNEVEGVITSARYTKWLSAPEVKDFDFAYYKEIHRFLLSVKEVAVVSLTQRCLFDPHRDPHGETSGQKQWRG